jgi:hypothetical protein
LPADESTRALLAARMTTPELPPTPTTDLGLHRDDLEVDSASTKCPTCDAELIPWTEDGFRCPENHQHTVLGLVQYTNAAAVRALWKAIRALEDDAFSLELMADQHGGAFGATADTRRAEAKEARADALLLRRHGSTPCLPHPRSSLSRTTSRAQASNRAPYGRHRTASGMRSGGTRAEDESRVSALPQPP